MTASRLLPLVALVLTGMTACDDTPTSLSFGDVQAFAAGAKKWEATAPDSYVYTLERLCFCLVEGPVRVTVRNGVVESAQYVSTGAYLTPPALEWISTIDEVFDALSYALAIPAAFFKAEYDPTYGFPVEASIDHWARTVDDEITYRLSDFAALP